MSHLRDNRYVVPADAHDHRCSLGVSPESAGYGGTDAFTAPGRVEVADPVKSRNGTALHRTGTLFDGCPVDLLALRNAYASGSERDLTADVGWTPRALLTELRGRRSGVGCVLSACRAEALVAELLGLLSGAASGGTPCSKSSGERAGRRDAAEIHQKGPNLHQKIDSAEKADRQVARGAGAGSIR